MRYTLLAVISFISLGIGCGSSDSELGADESPPAEPSGQFEIPTTDIFKVPGLGTFYLPYPNDTIQKTLRKGEIWESRNHAVFEALIRPGKDVVDVGAYIGSHTIKFANLAKPGKVYAFEPQEDIHKILSQNIALNDLADTATAYKMALGDQACNTKMVRGPKNKDTPETFSNRGANRVLGCLDDAGDPLAFEMRTLDSFELDNVGFIKIDVEGAHLLVLKGAEETLKRNRPVMLIEILGGTGGQDFTHHDATPREEVIQWLEERGYGALQWRASDYIAIPLP
jgi:FkbM family methyltransferase